MAYTKRPFNGEEFQYVKIPVSIARGGRTLTGSELKLYIAIKSYNPAYPSCKTLQKDAGLGKSAFLNAMKGLLGKNLIHRVSGASTRTNNEYFLLAEKDWVLADPQSETNSQKCSKRSGGRSESDPPLGLIQTLTRSESDPQLGLKPDHQIDQLNRSIIRDDATRQRCPVGQITKDQNQEKGIGLLADAIERRTMEVTKTEKAQTENSGRGVEGATFEPKFEPRPAELSSTKVIKDNEAWESGGLTVERIRADRERLFGNSVAQTSK